MKHILGISAGFHDAAISVIAENGDIMFAGHSERYSRIKNDPTIHPELLRECCNYYIDEIAFYERPWMHNWQQLRSGQYNWGPWTTGQAIRQHLGDWYQFGQRKRSWPHHLSHAAAGFQTSSFDEAAVVVKHRIRVVARCLCVDVCPVGVELQPGLASGKARLWRVATPRHGRAGVVAAFGVDAAHHRGWVVAALLHRCAPVVADFDVLVVVNAGKRHIGHAQLFALVHIRRALKAVQPGA